MYGRCPLPPPLPSPLSLVSVLARRVYTLIASISLIENVSALFCFPVMLSSNSYIESTLSAVSLLFLCCFVRYFARNRDETTLPCYVSSYFLLSYTLTSGNTTSLTRTSSGDVIFLSVILPLAVTEDSSEVLSPSTN